LSMHSIGRKFRFTAQLKFVSHFRSFSVRYRSNVLLYTAVFDSLVNSHTDFAKWAFALSNFEILIGISCLTGLNGSSRFC